MTQVILTPGMIYPNTADPAIDFTSSSGVIDATGEKIAYIGRLFINGRPGGTKTLSTGTIKFNASGVTFANAGTTLEIGIQDVATGAGPVVQPDGTFDVSTTLTGGGGGLVSGYNTVTMNSGTKSMAHGDLFAIVFDMTAKAGADTAVIATNTGGFQNEGQNHLPATNAYLAGAWQALGATTGGAGRKPLALITFDDGTLGWFDDEGPCLPFKAVLSEGFSDSTNPDERGMIFQVPWDCAIDAIWCVIGIAGATSDFTISLYSDPAGTPTLMDSVAVLAENMASSGQRFLLTPLGNDVSLSKNTDYMIAIRATGAGNITLRGGTYDDAAHRVGEMNGANSKKATRNNGSGAFTAESPAISTYSMGIRICSFDDGAGAGSGGGGLKLAGRGGLAG